MNSLEYAANSLASAVWSLERLLLLIGCAFDQGQRKRLFFLTFFNVIDFRSLESFHRDMFIYGG